MKNIALSVDYNWLDKLETTIKSILVHNDNVNIYVINPDIPHEWFINVNRFAKKINSKIIDKKYDISRFDELSSPEERISKAVYGKFLIPELIPENKVLYLGCDLVVDSSLDDLFETKIDDKSLYAVIDYFTPSQFNSGVLFINNAYWKNNNFGNQLLEIAKKTQISDTQELINSAFSKEKIGNLDIKFNFQIGYEKDSYWKENWSSQYYLDNTMTPKVIHYSSKNKPFTVSTSNNLREKWWYYHNLEWWQIAERNLSDSGGLLFDLQALVYLRFAENRELEDIIKSLPNVHFNVASTTEMANNLVVLAQYDNVSVYPTITSFDLRSLIENIDFYLDIGYGEKYKNVTTLIQVLKIPTIAFNDTQAKDQINDSYTIFESKSKLINAIKQLSPKKKKNDITGIFDIKVKSIEDTIDEIIKTKKSVVRFGDGEFDLIIGKDIRYQTYSSKLSDTLKDLILHQNDHILPCLPNIFDGVSDYDMSSRSFYTFIVVPRNFKLFKQIEAANITYGSAFISRPYINLKDKSKSEIYFDKLREIWKDKDLLIVEGEYTRSGVGNDLFDNSRSIKRIICPATNAYDRIDKIEEAIKSNAENRLVLLMLGPTAKAIVQDLQNLDNQMIDIGHIDSEYEWFTHDAKYRTDLNIDKHIAERDYRDSNLGDETDPEYLSEIVEVIK